MANQVVSVLYTAFEKFGRLLPTNPSQSVLNEIAAKPNQYIGDPDIEIKTAILPVSIRSMTAEIEKLAQEAGQPDLQIHTGVAAGRDVVTVEMAARNWQFVDQPDNDGLKIARGPIKTDRPALHFSTLFGSPKQDLARAESLIREAAQNVQSGVCAIEPSFDAGEHCCNSILYNALDYWQQVADDETLFPLPRRIPRIGFIHVPFVLEELPEAWTETHPARKAAFSLRQIAATVGGIIREAVRKYRADSTVSL